MIGKLRHRITIQEKTRTSDSQGGFTESWSTFKTRWAKVSPPNAKQVFFADKLEHNITHVVRIRYTTGITSDMRIQHRGRTLQIRGINDIDERRIWNDLYCEEGTGS